MLTRADVIVPDQNLRNINTNKSETMLILAAKKLQRVDRRHFSYTQRTIFCHTEFRNENKTALLCNTSEAVDSVR